MLGAIIGDIVGSPYEGSVLNWVDDRNFPLFAFEWSRFTDDTVLTCATAETILETVPNQVYNVTSFADSYKKWARKYPGRGYGSMFQEWVESTEHKLVNSWSNGCMMRCSPIAIYSKTIEEARDLALESSCVTHNSPESDRGVQSIVSAIFMAKNGCSKEAIRKYVEENFGHMLDLTVEQWRNHPKPNIRCNITAPQALVAFMESDSYESAIRNAVYTKGDTDTIAAITGSIAEAFYGTASIPTEILQEALSRLPDEILKLIHNFYFEIGQKNEKYEGFV